MGTTKLERSNKAHQRLAEHYSDVQRKTKMSDPKSFWAYVKSNYHYKILIQQKHEKKIVSGIEKKKIYKRLVDSCAEDNKIFSGAYVPKKYR